MSENRFSPKIRERRIQEILRRSQARVEFLVKAGVSAAPAGSASEYQQILAWRTSGDPRFWNNPQIQARFALLSQRFGAPTPIQQPFGTSAPASGPATYRAANEVAMSDLHPGPINPALPAMPEVPGIPQEV